MGESRLISTNASILTRIGSRYFFYNNDNGQKPYFDYEGKPYDNIVVLTREDAEHAYVFGNRPVSYTHLDVYKRQTYVSQNICYDS